jgi:hypothetical protein
MAMDGAGAPVRAVRAIAYKLAFTKLDDLSKAGFVVDINLSCLLYTSDAADEMD